MLVTEIKRRDYKIITAAVQIFYHMAAGPISLEWVLEKIRHDHPHEGKDIDELINGNRG